MKEYYVYSTMSCDKSYVKYRRGGGDLPLAERKVLIKGGAGVADKRVFTPLGVVTKITEEQMEICKADVAFKRHQDRGFILVKEKEYDPEVVAADMSSRDGSSPLVPEDFEDSSAKPSDYEEPAPKKRGRGRPKKK